MLELKFIALAVSILQLALHCGGTATCVKTDSCSCKYSDGSGVISLKTLVPANQPLSQPRFDFTAAPDGYFYAYSPCQSFSYKSSSCQKVATCQKSQDGKDVFDIGNQNSANFNMVGTSVKLTYNATTGSTFRKSIVTLQCDPSATTPKLTPQGEVRKDIYEFTLISNCACKNGCIGGGISPGSVVCILFSVVVILYVVVGLLFLKFVRGAEGKELIPNYEFWMDLPLLIKDGVLFLVHGCKSDSNNYEQI